MAATAAAVALTVVGARRGDGRTVLVGTAFTAMAGLLAIHGLATRAVALLREEAGEAFDPRCVAALERVLAREAAAGLAVAV